MRAAEGSSGSSVAGLDPPRNKATTAATPRSRRPTSTSPCRKEPTEVAGVGVPMITTSIAMPRTPPIWRVLEATAEAVA